MPRPLPPLSLPRIPDPFLAFLAQLAQGQFGRAAPDDRTLAAAVQDVSRRYTRDRAQLMDSQGDPASLSARLRFFLPRDMYKVWGPLTELVQLQAAPQRDTLRVLDLGAGLGTTSLGLATFAAKHSLCEQLHITAVDSDAAALTLLSKVLSQAKGLTLPTLQVHQQARTLEVDSQLPRGPFDVILCGLALNEILLPLPLEARTEAGATFLTRLCQQLDDDGCLIVIEPALRQEARTLSAVRDVLVGTPTAPHIFGPCLGTAPCPMLTRKRDWCHERLPAELPGQLGDLSRAAGLRDEGLTYSYLTLRKRPLNLATLADADQRPYRIVGGPVGSKGKTEYTLCGQQDAPRLLRLDRHRDRKNDPLKTVGRGTLLGLGPLDALPEPGASTVRLKPGVEAPALLTWEKHQED